MKYLTIILLCVLPLAGCGAYTLANGNRVQLHEKLGLTATLQVVEETTAEGEYVDHTTHLGPGVIPMATDATVRPVAAYLGRKRVNISNDSTSNSEGGAGGAGGDGGKGVGLGIGIGIGGGGDDGDDDDDDDDDDDYECEDDD